MLFRSEAFSTLGDAHKRARYDESLEVLRSRRQPVSPPPAPVVTVAAPVARSSFWTWPSMLIAGAVVLGLAALAFSHLETRARLEADARLAEAKAATMRAVQDRARAEADAQRLAAQREREQAREAQLEEQRRMQERQSALRDLHGDSQRLAALEQGRAEQERAMRQRELSEQRGAEQRRRQEEQQAALAARQQASRERAELCRLERERYGRVISC